MFYFLSADVEIDNCEDDEQHSDDLGCGKLFMEEQGAHNCGYKRLYRRKDGCLPGINSAQPLCIKQERKNRAEQGETQCGQQAADLK